MDSWKKFLSWYFAITFLVLFSVASVNAVVDPYGKLFWVYKQGFNANKYTDDFQARDFKASKLYSCTYDNFIMGTSRAETGINPKSEYMPAGKGFNAALRGTNFYETAYLTDYLLERQQPKMVVIGLDFVAFNENLKGPGEFVGSMLDQDRGVFDLLPYLFSFETLDLSYQVASWNRSDPDLRCSYDGFHTEQQLARYASSGLSTREKFLVIAEQYLTNPESYADYVYYGDRVERFRAVLRKLMERGVEVKLFISPVHAFQKETIELAGLRPLVERWKRDLVTTVADVNEALPESEQLVLWDFSGYNSVNTESVPLIGDKMMDGFRDPAHYRNHIGDIILQKLNGTSVAPDDFGRVLTPDNLDEAAAAGRAGRADFRQAQPELIQDLEQVLERVLTPGQS